MAGRAGSRPAGSVGPRHPGLVPFAIAAAAELAWLATLAWLAWRN